MKIETEICCFSLNSALIAHELSVDRVELCGGFLEGGTTPSQGLIELVKAKINPAIYVMIRPRGGDFCYSETEAQTIFSEILSIKKLHPEGFVFGALTSEGEIDEKLCKKVIGLAKPFPITFHRAFDQCVDPLKALGQIIDLGFERILTSGQKNSALDGLSLIETLKNNSIGQIQIMAGAGINAENVSHFRDAKIEAIHFTAKEWQYSKMNSENKVNMMASAMPDSLGKFETSLKLASEIFEKLKT